MKKLRIPAAFAALLLITALCGCTEQGLPMPTDIPTQSPSPTATVLPTAMATESPAPTMTPTMTPTMSPTVTPTMVPTVVPTATFAPTPTPTPELLSIARLLLLAKEPLGQTMYVWGGGWNEEDTGAGTEARTLGISPAWIAFAAKQDSFYDYQTTRYQIHNGLDCSGYIGWLVYNLLETENGNDGYVMSSTLMASAFSELGLGDYTTASQITDWQAGDIMSMNGHVWLSLGMCADGSVVLLHASPPGVILSGTLLPDGSESQATMLASHYMATYYPDWYSRFPEVSRPHNYLTKSNRMRWYDSILSDSENLREESAEKVLAWLFSE